MSVNIKTQSGLQTLHSVRVAKSIYMEIPIESGGYTGTAALGGFIGADNGAQVSDERCRVKNIPFLPAGMYRIEKSPTAPNDLQFNVGQCELSTDTDLSYGFVCTVVGAWGSVGQPVTVTLASDGYLTILVRKENNVNITPETAGGYVIIRKEV